MKTATQPFIVLATCILLSLSASVANAQPWLAGTNGSIYNPNYSTGGYVGIGTNNPTATLEIANTPQHTFHAGVVGNRANCNIQMLGSAAVIAGDNVSNALVGAVAYNFFDEVNPSNSSWSGAILQYFGLGVTGTQYGAPAANQGQLLFQNVNSGVIASNGANIFISPLGTLSASFLTNGNVGIGTTDTKGYKFAVNGDAIFNKVVVKPYPWADYVFDSTYRLRPLDKVAQYIRDNHHLPEIPSADSVEKTGIDVGANQAALLKKIEELTLYIIEQDKTLRETRQQVVEEREQMKDELDRQRRVQQSQQARIDRIERLLAEKLK